MQKFTVTQFFRRFATERACIEHLAALRFPNGITCPKCECITTHYLIEKRKCYECKACGNQFYPTEGTIFYKSRTPLTVWFYVVHAMSQTRCGVSAKEIERETGVTYKTAWKMCQLVRAALAEGEGAAAFSGTVEVDETYIGGKPRYKGQHRRKSWDEKTAVVGMVERGGRVRAFIVPFVRTMNVLPLIAENVEAGATICTDEAAFYKTLPRLGFQHDSIKHRSLQYVREVTDEATGEVRSVHTNTIEGFWSHVKGGVTSVHKGVSRRYLQRYVDEFAFRYSHRKGDAPMFTAMLSRIAGAGQPSATLP
jgi:transposase